MELIPPRQMAKPYESVQITRASRVRVLSVSSTETGINRKNLKMELATVKAEQVGMWVWVCTVQHGETKHRRASVKTDKTKMKTERKFFLKQAYLLLELLALFWGECVCFGDQRDDVHLLVQPFHELDVQRLQPTGQQPWHSAFNTSEPPPL